MCEGYKSGLEPYFTITIGFKAHHYLKSSDNKSMEIDYLIKYRKRLCLSHLQTVI